jgi:hypothetical protein
VFPETAPRGPFVVVGMRGAVDLALTIIGTAGTMRLLFGPVGGSLATAVGAAGGGAVVVAAGPGASASETAGFESFGGVGPGAGDTVETGVGLLAAAVDCGLSSTGSSFGAWGGC